MADCFARIVGRCADAEFSPGSRGSVQRNRFVSAKLWQSVAIAGTAYVVCWLCDCGAWVRDEFVSPDFAFLDKPAGVAGVGANPTICFAGVYLPTNALLVCRGNRFARKTKPTSAFGDLGDGGNFFAYALAELDVDAADFAWRIVVGLGV